ncbi:hypothetical protein BY996DRAFT_4097604 [Phakopsora pachyrhizi]|nr:hypothetical protein BY996DRAFT_4097604 [Phakopsora pachyrhizi]
MAIKKLSVQERLWLTFCSPLKIPIMKAVMAYTLSLILLFSIQPCKKTLEIPGVGSSTILLCAVGFPGKSSGACIQGLILSIIGLGFGSLNFYILALSGPYPYLQAILLFVAIYGYYVLSDSSCSHLKHSCRDFCITPKILCGKHFIYYRNF